MSETEEQTYPRTVRSRARRLPQRASYDKAAVHAILDASLLCHVGYVLNGQAFVTPTAFWREGDTLYWHGSAASRMIESIDGKEICVTVSHLDGLVLARSAFHHSLEYRSAMLFGRARLVLDLDVKRRLLRGFIERLYPGRSARIRESSDNELKQISLVAFDPVEAVAKVRSQGVVDDEPDYALPVWAGVLPITPIVGLPIADARMAAPTPAPDYVQAYTGQRIDEALRRFAEKYGEGA